MNPLVALTTSIQPSSEAEKPKAVIFASYITVLQRVGLTPVLVTPAHSPEAITELVSACSGLVLSGGADIDPARYGQTPIPELGEVNLPRDAAEFHALEVGLGLGMPVLGICRGHQLINVALGGTLCQDIEAAAFGGGHVQTSPWGSHHHGVTVEGDSIVGRAIGVERIEINSYHHQALDQVAPALRVSARADDGMVEAVESREHGWVVGVQWHPERHEADAPEADPNIRVLAAFAAAVRGRQGQHHPDARTRLPTSG